MNRALKGNLLNRSLACAVLLAAGTVGSFADDDPQTKPSNTPSTTPPAASADSLNIDLLKLLDVGGQYIRLEGRSLFLTWTVDPKAQQAGFWFDIEPDPASPVLVNKSLPGAWDVAVAGDHAFVCDYTAFLTVVDLRDHQWREVTKLKMPSYTENIEVRDKLAYVANHTAGLTVVDTADPAKPSIISNINPRIDCDGVALWKNYAVLYGHQESRLVLVDITDPAKPRQVGVYQHDKGSFNQAEVKVDGDFAYCTARTGLVIVNITDPANPKLVKTVDIKGGITDVTVMDGYAFLAAGRNGIRVFDVSDPANPTEVGRYPGNGAQAANELAVLRAPQAQDVNKLPANQTRVVPASYLIYAAAPRAEVLRFRPPVREGAKTR
jgi:hypothetical protein